jgi:hypothetical protein
MQDTEPNQDAALDNAGDNNCAPEPARPSEEIVRVQQVVRALRAENKALREQVLSHNRTIAALVMQAGGEVRVDDLIIAMLPLDAEIIMWSESMERKTVVQIRKPKRQNVPVSDGATKRL